MHREDIRKLLVEGNLKKIALVEERKLESIFPKEEDGFLHMVKTCFDNGEISDPSIANKVLRNKSTKKFKDHTGSGGFPEWWLFCRSTPCDASAGPKSATEDYERYFENPGWVDASLMRDLKSLMKAAPSDEGKAVLDHFTSQMAGKWEAAYKDIVAGGDIKSHKHEIDMALEWLRLKSHSGKDVLSSMQASEAVIAKYSASIYAFALIREGVINSVAPATDNPEYYMFFMEAFSDELDALKWNLRLDIHFNQQEVKGIARAALERQKLTVLTMAAPPPTRDGRPAHNQQDDTLAPTPGDMISFTSQAARKRWLNIIKNNSHEDIVGNLSPRMREILSKDRHIVIALRDCKIKSQSKASASAQRAPTKRPPRL